MGGGKREREREEGLEGERSTGMRKGGSVDGKEKEGRREEERGEKEGGREKGTMEGRGKVEGGSTSSFHSGYKNLQSRLGAPPGSTSVEERNQILELPSLLLFHLK